MSWLLTCRCANYDQSPSYVLLEEALDRAPLGLSHTSSRNQIDAPERTNVQLFDDDNAAMKNHVTCQAVVCNENLTRTVDSVTSLITLEMSTRLRDSFA